MDKKYVKKEIQKEVKKEIKENNDIIEIDMKDFFDGLLQKGNTSNLDFEKAISYSLLYALKKFHETSEVSKYDSKAISILSSSCPLMKDILNNMIIMKKDYKRKRENLWYNIIKTMSNNMKIEKDNDEKGFFSFLHKNRD